MCKQAKTGYIECAHVYADGEIELCGEALDPDNGEVCDDVTYYWNELKFPGKCFWCREREKEKEKGNRKTWGGGKVKERPDWLK
jgi:hypothetical protein